jgi:Flp pilus assembly protein TadG
MDANGLTMAKFLHIARLKDSRGTSAIEFAILAPVFIGMMIGTLYMCMLLFVVGSLHYAVEEAARCSSVKTTVCSDSATTLAYARSHFNGASILTPSFVYSTPSCGHSVTASANYIFDFGLTRTTVPISAAACFP